MKCFVSDRSDPFFNLAAEEYLLRNCEDEVCMLWQSAPAVVVGKHQNALAEINYRFVRQKGVVVARRLTGGGTVYHDKGTLNFTFIRRGEPGRMIEFRKHLSPIIDFLGSYGIDAHPGPKHEILVDKNKISGNAEHIFRNKVLHHGTLLLNTDLHVLRSAILHQGGIYNDKAVQSNRSNVINLNEFLSPDVNISSFIHDLFHYLMDYFDGHPYALSNAEEKAILALAGTKYSAWEWIYGWSPDYEFRNRVKTGGFEALVSFKAHRGRIKDFNMETDNLSSKDRLRVNNAFENTIHTYEEVQHVLKVNGFWEKVKQEDWEDFVFSFF